MILTRKTMAASVAIVALTRVQEEYKMKRITGLLVMLFSTLAFSQMGVSVDAERGFASNIFSNYRQMPDYYNHIEGQLYYDSIKESSGLRTYYNGSGMLFQEFNYKSFQIHKLGLSYYSNVGQNGGRLNAGASASTRLHSSDYKYYEYQQGNGFVNIKLLLHPQAYGYAGVSFRLRNYSSLKPYSFWQNVAYVRGSRFFNTGTTIIAEFDYMQKQYLEANPAPIDNLYELQTQGDGDSRQLVGLLRAAQAITPKTGLSAQVLVRRNLQSSVRYIIDPDGYYYSDEELFDDVFGYAAEQVTVTLKRNLPWKMQASLGGTFIAKHYTNRLALDLDGYPINGGSLREDGRSLGWLTIKKNWQYSKYMAPVQLELSFTYLNNESNDPYYNFHARYFSFGISQSF